MMSGAHHSLIPGGHSAEQIARRDAAMARIRELLPAKPQSCFDLSAELGIPSDTVYGYLRTMQEEGEIYQMEHADARGRKTWAMDDDALQVAAGRAAAEHSKRAWIVPARQMGMPRDPLVAALFGPAQQGAAA